MDNGNWAVTVLELKQFEVPLSEFVVNADPGTKIRVAVNEGYASWDAPLHDGDTVAFLPPVAGGSAERVNVLVTRSPLDARKCEELVRSDADGAVCTFTGVVLTRDIDPLNPDKVEHKWYAKGVGPVHVIRIGSAHHEEIKLVKHN